MIRLEELKSIKNTLPNTTRTKGINQLLSYSKQNIDNFQKSRKELKNIDADISRLEATQRLFTNEYNKFKNEKKNTSTSFAKYKSDIIEKFEKRNEKLTELKKEKNTLLE